MFYFHPDPWGSFPLWLFVSDGLVQPPSSLRRSESILQHLPTSTRFRCVNINSWHDVDFIVLSLWCGNCSTLGETVLREFWTGDYQVDMVNCSIIYRVLKTSKVIYDDINHIITSHMFKCFYHVPYGGISCINRKLEFENEVVRLPSPKITAIFYAWD